MANNPDVVAVEVEARLEGFNAKMKGGEQQFDQSMNRIKSSAGKAEAAVTSSMNGIARGMDKAGMRSRMLGYQIADIGTQLTAGTNPFLILSQQAPQVANALDGTTGAMGRMATFLSGPLGAALLAAASILGVMAIRSMKDTDETDKQTAAKKTLREAIADLEKTTRGALETQAEATRKMELQTKATLDSAIAVRQRTKALLEAALAEVEIEKGIAVLAAGAGAPIDLAQREVRRLNEQIALYRSQIGIQDMQIDQAQRAVSDAQASSALRRAEAATDSVAKATLDYEEALAKLDGRRRTGLLGPVGSEAAAKAYEREAIALMKVRDAAIEAARAKDRKTDPNAASTIDIAFANPAPGSRQTSGFGYRTDPINGERRFHAGVDLAGGPGKITAPADGTVIRTGTVSGFGNVVWIDHGNGVISELNHLKSQTVAVGDVVQSGQQVGVMGSTGRSTGVHLDWRVRTGASAQGTGGRYVDPTRGKFRVNPGDAASNATDAILRADELAEKQANAFSAEMAEINQAILAARRPLITSYEQDLALAEEAIKVERDRQNMAYLAAASEEKITAVQAELLIAKNNELASARINANKEREAERQKRAQGDIAIARQQIEVSAQQAELDQAKTAAERKDVALRLLDAELELERIKLQQIVDTAKAGSAEAEIAKLRLADLERLRGVGTTEINNDPANQSPLQQLSADLDKTSGEMIEDLQRIAVEGVKTLEDGIVDAIMNAKSLGDVFDQVASQIIAALIRIAVQQAIIKPLTSLLGGGGGGGSALTGSGVPPIFSGGMPYLPGRASGGPVSSNRAYMVGEQGPEVFVPGTSGSIVPNNGRAFGGGGSSLIQTFVLDARGGIVTQDLLRQVNALATTRAAQAGRAAYDASQRSMPGRIATFGKLGS